MEFFFWEESIHFYQNNIVPCGYV